MCEGNGDPRGCAGAVINWANPTYIDNPEFCFCRNTVARFRDWLKARYSTLDALNKSNSAYIVLLKPFEERRAPDQDVHGILARLRAEFHAFSDANVFAFNVPPIIGLGTGGGFEYQLEDLRGGKPVELAAVARGLMVAANQEPKLSSVFTSYSANTPQLYLDLDRDKVQTLGVAVSDVFNALQATLGGFYTNDFNVFGRRRSILNSSLTFGIATRRHRSCARWKRFSRFGSKGYP